jgi:hypothetical protein
VLVFAPRIPRRLLDEIELLSHRDGPIAEINRLVGATAARLRLHRPSYEQVRVLVHAARRLRRVAPISFSVAVHVGFEIATRGALLERLLGERRPRLGNRAPPPQRGQ